MREVGVKRIVGTSVDKNRQDFIVMHFLLKDLELVVSQYANGNLLDIGCGNKPYESLFKGKIGNYVGCDVVQSDLEKVDVICEATKLDFESGVFDTVFSTQVIEHVNDPFQMLKESYRVLKNNGVIIVSAPFCWELHEEPYDFFRYSKYGLKSMFENAGFEVDLIKENGGKWAAVAQLWLNMIYSSFHSKKWYAKLWKGLFINLRMTSLYNSFFVWFDKKYTSYLLTLNYVVVAHKK